MCDCSSTSCVEPVMSQDTKRTLRDLRAQVGNLTAILNEEREEWEKRMKSQIRMARRVSVVRAAEREVWEMSIYNLKEEKRRLEKKV